VNSAAGTPPSLYLSHIADRDRLVGLEFGRVHDGQPATAWESENERCGFMRDESDGRIVGFVIDGFAGLDVDRSDLGRLWHTARFRVPLLGLENSTAPEIVLSARALIGDRPTLNRRLFAEALEAQHEDLDEALSWWLSCLEAGDSMAHFGLGYTLYDLGRYREAYRHLRYYAGLGPAAPWNWCWLGKAAEAVGERSEARAAYLRAIELSAAPDDTEAPGLLARLDEAAAISECDGFPVYAGGVDTEAGEPPADAFSERFEDALSFAAATHRHQVRKGSGIPYVGHLLGVSSLVIEDGGSENEAIAALLHDAVEDQGGAPMLAEIRSRFGDEVAMIVEACSDTLETPKPPWRARKEAYLAHLDGQPDSVLRVSLADKLFNTRAILRDYLVVGDEVWDRFKFGRDEQLWYYRGLSDRFSRLLPGVMATELDDTVAAIESATRPTPQ
jgi:tetratricopeptide (TPR) repeat protein